MRLISVSPGKDLQRALWTDPPSTRLMPGVPRWVIIIIIDCSISLLTIIQSTIDLIHRLYIFINSILNLIRNIIIIIRRIFIFNILIIINCIREVFK